MAIDVNNYTAPAGQIRVTVPTHVSPNGGQATHPSIIKFDEPWNGYTYWMGITPYPTSNDAHEDPNVIASVDGQNWEVPPGLTNPLDDQPGSPGAYNSDINLVYREDNDTLYAFWRTLDRSLASNQEKLYYRSSTDGVTWTPKALVIQVTTPAKSQLLSPKFRWTGSNWQMWVVDDVPSPNVLRRYTSTGSAPTAWSAPVACTLNNLRDDEDLWHFDFCEVGSEFVALANMWKRDATVADYWMRLAVSTDGGLTWTLSDNQVIEKTGPWQDWVYKGTLLPIYDSWGNVDFDVWYKGALNGPPIVNNILRTRLTHINDVIPPTVPEITSAVATDVGTATIKWLPSYDDRGVASYIVSRGGHPVATLPATAREFTDYGLALGVSVDYRVIATDVAGNVSLSDEATVSIPVIAPPTLPDNWTPGDAIEVRITGDGALAGQAAALADYTVTEDATPVSILDDGGGVGSVSFSALEEEGIDGSILLHRQPFELFDPDKGVVTGVIDTADSDDGILNVTGYPHGYTMVGRRTAPAFYGLLSSAFYYYFALAGVREGIVIDASADWIDDEYTALPSWNDDVWVMIRDLAAANGLEVASVGGRYVIRGLRGREVDFNNLASIKMNYGGGEAAATVTLEYETREWRGIGLAYPDLADSILDRPIISLEAGELYQNNIKVNAHLTSLSQPSHLAKLPFEATNILTSAYSVIDKDGKVVTPAEWTNAGGWMSAEIGEDGQSIDLTIQAAYTQSRAPYRIASASADGEFAWGALYLVGSGVFFTEREVSFATGADPDVAPADSEVRIKNDMVDSTAKANTVAINAALRRAGHAQSIHVEAPYVNRRGRLGNKVGLTFDQFQAKYPTETFDDFDDIFPTETFDEFDAEMVGDVQNDFANQAFGGVAGARCRYRDQMYRITTASITATGYEWDAISDTTFSDFEEEWGETATFNDFDAAWTGKTFEQFDLMPLHT